MDRDKDRGGRKPPKEQLPPANMDDLDDYMELLYQVGGRTEKEKEQTHTAQVRGTAMILSLCRNVLNLEQLIQNGTVMGALTRVLQEEYKKSVELSFNILRIFLAFSNFVEMHPLMTNYRIGVLTMKALELQVNRTEHRKIEQQTKEEEITILLFTKNYLSLYGSEIKATFVNPEPESKPIISRTRP